VVLAAAAFAGGAYAAATKPATSPRQALLNDLAKRLHVTRAQLDSALKRAALDDLSAAVKAGRLTQAQANALKQRIENGTAAPFFFGFGAHGFGGHRFFGGPLGAHGPLAAAATYLGLTDAQVAKQLGGGKSLAQIAKARGKSTSGLEQALTAAVKARLDKAVANKRITSAQEQKLLSRLSSRIADLINRAPGRFENADHQRMGRHAFGYHWFGGRFARPGRFAPAPGDGGGAAGLAAAPSASGPIA
jgi:hypothetical protein